jgi:Cu(I)/Ag(I) efflux system membrane fusion protein
MKAKNKKYLKTAGILIIGILLGWLLFGGDEKQEENHDHANADIEQIWTCSMHPQIRRDEPGSCPICGMDLIPLESEGVSDDPNMYQMSENAIKLANIQTIIVGKGDASKEIRLNGKVQVDERHAYSQSTHIPGRIEQLAVNFTGEKVSRGQTLAIIYSPELVTAQEELLQAASIKKSQPELFEAAQEKLRNWKISQAQIDKIIANGKAIQRFSIHSDVNGIVTEKMVELGDYVERGMPIYQISDLSKVWVLFDLYESELAWIREGSEIEYTVKSLPGETFTGKISFIDPLINSQTRVASARVEVSNKDGRLKPEMFASGVVKNKIGKVDTQEIVIPKSAVLWTGKRSVVYIKEGSGFKMREITLGPALGDAYIIQDGLEPGEEIVSNGTFTVDAAVQLSGRPSMMNPEGGATSTGHNHGDMPMAQTDTELTKIELSKEVKSELENVVNHYINMKDALVKNDFETAKKQASTLNKLIQKMDQMKFTSEAKTGWDKISLQLNTRSIQLSKAKDLEEIRSGFNTFSAEIIMLVTIFQPMENILYVQHCPMADNERGADWLSLSPDVKNPYFGSVMLNCGEIKKQIK